MGSMAVELGKAVGAKVGGAQEWVKANSFGRKRWKLLKDVEGHFFWSRCLAANRTGHRRSKFR